MNSYLRNMCGKIPWKKQEYSLQRCLRLTLMGIKKVVRPSPKEVVRQKKVREGPWEMRFIQYIVLGPKL